VRLLVRQLELDELVSRPDARAPLIERLERHVAALAEGDRLELAAQVRLEQRLAGGNHACAAVRKVADQLSLGRGHALDRAEEL
jgi:hypothetical protein